MTTIELRAEPYTIPADANGAVTSIGTCESLDLWSCDQIGISGIQEGIETVSSFHRTIEGRIRRDVLGSYRKFTISYETLPLNRYNKLKEWLYKQDCLGQCLQMAVASSCFECDCANPMNDTDWMYGVLSIDGGEYDQHDFINNITISFIESKGDCQAC